MIYHTSVKTFCGNLLLACVILLSTRISAQAEATPLRQVRFIENKGQLTDMQGNLVPFVFFKASAPGLELYVTDKGLTYSFIKTEEEDEEERERDEREGESDLTKVHSYSWDVVNLDLKGANIRKENIILEELQQGSHHFYTTRFPDGAPVAHEYGKIIIKDVYPGIDWVLYNTNRGGFKYDFILSPGSNADNIRLSYTSFAGARLNATGAIEVATKYGTLKEDKPVSYLKSSKKPLGSSFVLLSSEVAGRLNTVVFGVKLDGRSVNQEVVIDPLLTWSTYFGGTSFEGTLATEIDVNTNLFIAGYTASSDFPYLNSGTYFQGTGTISAVSFICKFSPAGVLLWSTNYTGTSHQDMAIDPGGNIYVTGAASGNLMPVQTNNTYFQSTSAGGGDAYIIKFDNLGNRLWATYFGGSGSDYAKSVCTDNSGNVFLTGTTSSNNFPLVNANTYYVSSLPTQAAFISKFSGNGTLVWSTYYAGFMPNNAAADNAGNLLLTGTSYSNLTTSNPGSGAYYQSSPGGTQDAAVIKFTNSGALTWATYFGGSDYDSGTSIIMSKNGKVYLLGTTSSSNLPVQNAGGYYDATLGGYNDVFISRFGTGGALEWSTYFGSSSYEYISTYDNLAVDSCNNVYMAFEADSAGLPVTPACDGGYYDAQFDSSGARDIFIARFDNSTQLNWATYAGGNGMDFRSTLATDKYNNLFVTGEWVVYNTTLTPNYIIVAEGNSSYTDSTHNGSDDVYIIKLGAPASLQSFSYMGPICTSAPTLAPLSTSLIPGGHFSSAPGLSVNPNTGVIYPSGSSPGIYTVHYNASESKCSCPQGTFEVATTATIQLLTGTSLTVAGTNTPCIGQVATRTVSGAYSYTWSNGFQATIFSAKIFSTTVLTVTGTTQNSCTSVYTFTIFSKPCAGLDEETLPGVKVYPNPNNGSFTIESQQPAELILTNMLGQHVRTIKVGKEEQQVEITDLPKGIYILKDLRSSSGRGLRIVVE